MSACRSCGAPVEWVVVEKSGKRMPLNPDPSPVGNVRKLAERDAEGNALVEVISGTPTTSTDMRYTSHFADCPNGPAHRKPKT